MIRTSHPMLVKVRYQSIILFSSFFFSLNPVNFHFTISFHFSYYQLFQVTEPRVIIPPHESAFIRLWFAPSDPTSAEVLVFINNESEQNEECLLVRVRVG